MVGAEQKTGKGMINQLAERLLFELQRSALVWNNFAGAIIDGWHPGRDLSFGAQFKGSDRERLDQLFKIRDYEVRRIVGVLRELGISTNPPATNYAPIYDELSAATEITSTSHKPI